MTRSTPDFAVRMEALLGAREAELRALIAADTDVVRHEHDRTEVLDSKDAAEEDSQALLDDTLAARAASELEDIAAARRRIAEGSYGTCASCGEAIDERRLLLLPAAPLCTRCQANLE